MESFQNKIISIPNLYRDLMVHFGSKETYSPVKEYLSDYRFH